MVFLTHTLFLNGFGYFIFTMTTIVRVKRHRGEDPVEALILSCKRKKTENSDSDHDLFKKVFNFSGTVEDKDDNIATSTVQSFKKGSKYSNLIKNHTPEIRSKQRKERRERSEDNRFTLLSCLRFRDAVENPEEDASADLKENFTIVDVSKDSGEKVSEQGAPDGCYVYDLYSVQDNDSDFNDLFMKNLLSIQPFKTELEYRNGEDCYEEIDPDEDDSNDENNWRNDYPDTDSSVEDDEDNDILAKKLKHCHLGDDECELSDDSGEDEYLHYEDEEHYHYYEAEDLAGKRYARYKANAMKQMIDDNDEIDADASESEDDFRDCEVLSYHGDSD